MTTAESWWASDTERDGDAPLVTAMQEVTSGSEDDGTLSVWGGAFSGFQVITTDERAELALTHRCGWQEAVVDGEYLGNIVFGPMLAHRREGCRR